MQIVSQELRNKTPAEAGPSPEILDICPQRTSGSTHSTCTVPLVEAVTLPSNSITSSNCAHIVAFSITTWTQIFHLMLSSGPWRSQQSAWSYRGIGPVLLEKVPAEKKRSAGHQCQKTSLPSHPVCLVYRLVSALHTTFHS